MQTTTHTFDTYLYKYVFSLLCATCYTNSAVIKPLKSDFKNTGKKKEKIQNHHCRILDKINLLSYGQF